MSRSLPALMMALALSSTQGLATSSYYVPIVEITHRSIFRIPPAPEFQVVSRCPDENSQCTAPTWTGELLLRITSDPVTGKLESFSWQLDGQEIPVVIPARLLEGKVILWDLVVAQPHVYLPAQFRDRIGGIGPPHVYLTGLNFLDSSCDSGRRDLRITYYLEAGEAEIVDYCHEPDERE